MHAHTLIHTASKKLKMCVEKKYTHKHRYTLWRSIHPTDFNALSEEFMVLSFGLKGVLLACTCNILD